MICYHYIFIYCSHDSIPAVNLKATDIDVKMHAVGDKSKSNEKRCWWQCKRIQRVWNATSWKKEEIFKSQPAFLDEKVWKSTDEFQCGISLLLPTKPVFYPLTIHVVALTFKFHLCEPCGNNFVTLGKIWKGFLVLFFDWSIFPCFQIIWASYCFTIIYLLMAQLMRITPVRMYHDKKADKSVATFMNPFIPFTFSKVELQHHSYTATSKQFFKNDKHKLFIDTQYFRSVADINRLTIKK